MNEAEAKKHIGKQVRILLSNNFHYSGKILDVSEDTLVLLDKFSQEVSLRLQDVMIFTPCLPNE